MLCGHLITLYMSTERKYNDHSQKQRRPGMVAHTFNSSTQDAEADGSLGAWGQSIEEFQESWNYIIQQFSCKEKEKKRKERRKPKTTKGSIKCSQYRAHCMWVHEWHTRDDSSCEAWTLCPMRQGLDSRGLCGDLMAPKSLTASTEQRQLWGNIQWIINGVIVRSLTNV